MAYIDQIKLSHFRNYDTLALSGLARGFIVLSGPNGAGKTNVLEAISVLAPGRGLRRAKIEELQNSAANMNAAQSWAVSARIQGGENESRIGTGLDPRSQKKKIIRINGENVTSQSVLGEYLSVFWLTPQMDNLFISPASERRRFFDRMILSFDPAHNGRMTRYEKALSQRSKLLREGNFDQSWLNALETQMAETGVALAATRADFARRLQTSMAKFDHPHFPDSRITLSGFLEDQLEKLPALELEERFRHALNHSREADSITGGAAIGPHRSDFMLVYQDRNMSADQCSTGEQKILLTGLVLAHAQLVTAEKGVPPVLLLDEVSAHLDENRRESLFNILGSLGGQIWLTGTDQSLFGDLQAHYLSVKDGRVSA